MPKKTKKPSPFDIKFTDLAQEEKAFKDEIYSEEYKSVSQETLLFLKDSLAKSVEGMLTSDQEKGIYIRVNESDLIRIKARAKDAGMPYQSYLKSFIHRLGKGEIDLGI